MLLGFLTATRRVYSIEIQGLLSNFLIAFYLFYIYMKVVYGYIRVSTVKQGQQGVSLQEQREAIERYAVRNDLSIVSWFEEQETAAKLGRPVFADMLKLLRARKADGVVIHKIDRGSRNLKDWTDLGALVDQGIELHFAHESIDLHSRGGRLSADIQAVIAADYVRNLRDEIKKGFYGRLKQGLYPLPAPVGYLDKGKGKPKGIDPDKAPLIKKTFELYATGGWSLDTLGEEMYRLNLRNRHGGRVTRNGFSQILNNPFYMGLIRIDRTGETFAGVHEPLISKSLFDCVKAVLTGKFNACRRKCDFTFRRLFQCRACGYSLIGESQKGHVYYRCHTKGCPVTSIREENVEGAILKTFSPIQLTEEEFASLRKKIGVLKAQWGEEQKTLANTLELHMDQLATRLHRLTDAYIDRMIEKRDFEERKTALLMEKRDLEEKLSHMKTGNNQVPDLMAEFLELAKSVHLTYKMALPEEKRDLLHQVTSNRSVSGKNIVIELKSPFRELAERGRLSNGAPQRDRPRTAGGEIANLANGAPQRDEPRTDADIDALFRRILHHFTTRRQHYPETLDFTFGRQ